MSVLRRLYSPLWQSRTYLDSTFLLLGLIFGVLWASLALSFYVTGLSLVIVWVGVPILLLTHRAMRGIAAVERWQVMKLLKERLPAIPPFRIAPYTYNEHRRSTHFGAWMHEVFHDGYSWRALAWVSIRLVTGPVGFAITVAFWITLLVLALAPVSLAFNWDGTQGVDFSWRFWLLLGPVAALVLVPPFLWSIRGFATLHRMLARWALGPCESERTAAATARAELAEQQVRIDQELHDSIGHMITMNIVQAGAGAHVFDSDPEFARQALKNIEERGRVAMSELDRIIATIRGDDAEPRMPLPGIEQIDDLIVASRAAGISVDAVVEVDSAPAALGRAAYAIVREAVTNAAKHAPGSEVHVHVATVPDALGVSVRNTKPSGTARVDEETVPGAHRRGGLRHGLAGIRDRVSLLGGVSDAGATPDRGFEVLALIPLEVFLAPLDSDAQAASAECCRWDRLRAKVDA